MTKRILFALLALFALSATFSAEPLSESNYDRTKRHILPTDDEEAWRKMPWRTTFWQGVIDANKEDKPILLFAMNGHPFGCT